MTTHISGRSEIYSQDQVHSDLKTGNISAPSLFELLLAIKQDLKDLEFDSGESADFVLPPPIQEKIRLYQLFIKENPNAVPSHKDPFPDYLDLSLISRSDLPAVFDRINNILPIDEPNTQLEYVDCFKKVSDNTIHQVDLLQKKESDLHERVKRMNRLSDELSKIEEEARQNNKETVSFDSDLLSRLEEFEDESWPDIQDLYIKTTDISLIKSRLTSKISETNHEMSRVMFQIERESKKLSQYLDLVIHGTRRNSFIDACVRGQLPRR